MGSKVQDSNEGSDFEDALEKEILLGAQVKTEMCEMLASAFETTVAQPIQTRYSQVEDLVTKVKDASDKCCDHLDTTITSVSVLKSGVDSLIVQSNSGLSEMQQGNEELQKQTELIQRTVSNLEDQAAKAARTNAEISALAVRLTALAESLQQDTCRNQTILDSIESEHVPMINRKAEEISRGAQELKESIKDIQSGFDDLTTQSKDANEKLVVLDAHIGEIGEKLDRSESESSRSLSSISRTKFWVVCSTFTAAAILILEIVQMITRS